MGNIGSLIVYLTKLSEQLEETLKEGVTAPLREVLMEFYFDIRRFICAFDRSDDRYLIYALRSEDSFEIKIFCVDPSKDLGERLAKGCGAVFFSATLLPVQYYKEMLSDTAASDYDLYVDSPFAEENRLLVAATDVSSRYTRRGRKEYERMAAYIRDIIRGKHGNYMVFFPSYQLMKDVFEVFTEMELMKAGHGLQLVVLYTVILDRLLINGKRQIQLKIISPEYQQINKKIQTDLDRGTTLLSIEGGYTGRPTYAVLTVVSPRELFKLQELIHATDPNAFITINEVREVRGRGFSLQKEYH